MKLGELPETELNHRLRASGLCLKVGPFLVRLHSGLTDFAAELQRMYFHHEVLVDSAFSDFHVTVRPPSNPRRWIRPQVGFYMDGRSPFKPLPRSQAFPLFEWGMNWCISSSFNTYLIFHAAILERHDRVVIMPGDPGAGKSTLAAALAFFGWRLFSDELALFDIVDCLAHPVTKTISLKNESIEVIREFVPGAVIGEVAYDTVKGNVAHLRPTANSVARAADTAKPGWVVFPRFDRRSQTIMTPVPKGEALIRLASNAFNYSALGVRGFELAAQIAESCDCFEFTYSDLTDGINTLSGLADQ